MSSQSLQLLEVAAWGAVGGLLAGIYPLIGERGIPRSERVDKDRFWFLVSFILLPIVGIGFAFLARSKCGQSVRAVWGPSLSLAQLRQPHGSTPANPLLAEPPLPHPVHRTPGHGHRRHDPPLPRSGPERAGVRPGGWVSDQPGTAPAFAVFLSHHGRNRGRNQGRS